MITLTAEIKIPQESKNPFIIGKGQLGFQRFGDFYYETEIIDKRNIISLESEIRDRADIDKPSFGLISSGGRLSFRDDNSRFLSYAQSGILKGNEKIEVFLNNTISETREQVGAYFANDWDYDNENHSVIVSFNDGLEEMQNIEVDTFDKRENSEYNGLKIFEYMQSLSREKGFEVYIDPYYELVLSDTNIEYPYINGGSLWSQWEKICKTFCFSMYKNRLGFITFERAFN